jgi:hypothetical protein
MQGPSCPSCNAKLLLRGTRVNRQTLDIEERKWYRLTGFRRYCPRCGVRLRSLGAGYLWTACCLLVISNALGAHRAVYETWGYPGLLPYYAAWMALFVALAMNIRYIRYPGHYA